MEQGVFQGWIKRPGESVRAGEPLFRLEGDKAVQDVEALDEGTLHVPADAPAEGSDVVVGQVIGFLLASGEVPPTTCGLKPADKKEDRNNGDLQLVETTAEVRPEVVVSERPFASPSVRRLARELGVGLRQVKPSGHVTADDLFRHVAQLIRAAGGLTAAPTQPAEMPAGPVPCRQRGLPAISPRAAKLALAHQLDWTRLVGGGAGGRIREADVLAALQVRRA